MSESEKTRAERYQRFSQGSMIVTLVLVLALGSICVGMAFEPHVASRWMARSGWILATFIALHLFLSRQASDGR